MSAEQSEPQDAVYIRMRGRVQGPFRPDQLQALHQRGQFSKAHEVSEDRLNWRSAATLKNVFVAPKNVRLPPLKAPRTEVDEAFDDAVDSLVEKEAEFLTPGPAKMVKAVWHYSVGKQTYGPVTMSELRDLLSGGQLMPSDLVWKDGLADWMPASQVPELSGTSVSRAAGRGGVVQPASCIACGHLMDEPAEFCPICGMLQFSLNGPKSRIVTAMLAFFLGTFGVHRFYLNQLEFGLVYPISAMILFVTSVICSVWNQPLLSLIFFTLSWLPFFVGVVEGIVFLCTTDASFSAHHNRR